MLTASSLRPLTWRVIFESTLGNTQKYYYNIKMHTQFSRVNSKIPIMENFKPKIFFERKITMSKKNTLGLRLDLVAVANTLEELIGERGAANDYPELVEIYEIINNLRVNSKIGCFEAFDKIDKAEQFVLATTNSKNDTIHVRGTSTDSFDAELAFGILARIRKNFSEETMYMLFMKMMGGAYDND